MNKINIKTTKEIQLMREAGKYHAEMCFLVKDFIREGVSTWDIDQVALKFIRENKLEPIQIGYFGYPCATCVGINENTVHAIPKKNVIVKNGDIVTFDCTIRRNGYCADGGFSVGIGEIDADAKRLLDTTKRALNAAISTCVEGKHTGDIGFAIYAVAQSEGFDTLDIFTAHGIGKEMHEEPEIPNWGEPGSGPMIKAGMTFALDTLLVEGSGQVDILKDSWTTKTKDGGRFGFFEHTVVVGKDKAEILTRP